MHLQRPCRCLRHASNDIVRGRRGVTADTAMRLARYFGGDAQSWLNLQTLHDLRIAEKANANKIEKKVTPLASTASRGAIGQQAGPLAPLASECSKIQRSAVHP